VGVVSGLMAWKGSGRRDERPISFLVQAPEGSRFDRRSMAPQPALSPDGRKLAFVAPLGSKPVIWVQTLGALRATALVGSENATFPFWSPDGRFIAFAAGNRLRQIAVSGDEAPEDICSCDAEFSGTWSATGDIIFAGSAGLYRVSAAGGEPVALTRVDRSRGEFSHRFPFMLPDGRRFLYLVRSSQDAHQGIFIGSLDEPQLKQRLVPDDSNASWDVGPDGQLYLIFVRDLALLAQPFSASLGKLTGAPIVLARPVIPGEAGRFAPFSAAGRTLVYRQRSLAHTRLTWRDRRGAMSGTIGDTGAEYAFPSLSPDDTRLAVARRDPATGKRDIWVADVERNVWERLTDDPVSAGFPLWAPDGGKVIFSSARAGPWDLYWHTANGTGQEAVFLHAATAASEKANPRDITRDGRFLLFEGGQALWLQPLDSNAPARPLVPSSHGRISPDGRWLAYTSPLEWGEREVYVTTFPTPTTRWRISTSGGEDPQWSRDGAELYYIAADKTLMAAAVRNAARAGTFARVSSTTLFRASFEPHSLEFGSVYSPARDGQRFLVLEVLNTDELSLAVTMNWIPGEH
jgi:Tol biopolymer transport system component